MILIRQPSVAINDESDSWHANMSENYLVRRNFWRQKIVEDVAAIARRAPGGRLLDMVICCHGDPGYLYLGQGFGFSDLPFFSLWRGLVDRIYIRACFLARIYLPNDEILDSRITRFGDGDQFCKRMARTIGCTIIASTEYQMTAYHNPHDPHGVLRPLPFGVLDNYEGQVMWYGPQGQLLPQSARGPSTINND